MMKSFIAISAATFLAGAYVNAETTPYAGQEQRDIATLSEEDVTALLDGRGWGFALAAELNGYPGPLHVLELADEIGLTDRQRMEVETIFDEMNAQARRLGSDYVAAEAELSQAFDLGTINGPELQALVGCIPQEEQMTMELLPLAYQTRSPSPSVQDQEDQRIGQQLPRRPAFECVQLQHCNHYWR